MRNGAIEIEDEGDGEICLRFCIKDIHVHHYITWAEAKVLGKLLMDAGEKARADWPGKHECDVINGMNRDEREVVYGTSEG